MWEVIEVKEEGGACWKEKSVGKAKEIAIIQNTVSTIKNISNKSLSVLPA